MISREAFDAYLESDGKIKFDLWAQDTKDWKWIQEFIPGLIVSSAGGMLPFQAEGLIQGYPWYYRDECGSANIKVGHPEKEAPYSPHMALYSSSCSVEEWKEREHFPETLLKLLLSLKRAPFLYSFLGRKTEFLEEEGPWVVGLVEGETEIGRGWGQNPEEAYLDMAQPSLYLMKYGATEEKQLAKFLLHDYSPIPLFRDEREFPELPPDFPAILGLE